MGDELQDEIDRIAAASELRAGEIEEMPIRPRRADIEAGRPILVWSSD